MTREEVLQVLKDHEAELKQRGVAHAALFGSLARGEAGPKSDIDIMIDFDPEAPITMWDYVAVIRYVKGLFRRRKADVVNHGGMNKYILPTAERDAIYAF
ncbi:MAG: nucleotidyltransferase family protein [Parcubacteria group bacterium]